MGEMRGTGRVLSRLGVPTTLLARLRWAFLLLCLLQLGGHVLQLLVAPERGAGVRTGAVVVMVATGAWWVWCYRRASFPLAGIAVEVVALVAVATVLDDPVRAVPLAFLAAMFRGLYQRLRRGALYVAVTLAVLIGITVLLPDDSGDRRVTEVLFAFAGIPAFMAVMHLVAQACTQVEETVVRGRLLARSGLAIAAATGEEEAREVSRATVAVLLDHLPGTTATLLPAGAPPPDDPDLVWQDFRAPVTADDQRVLRVVGPQPLRDELARALEIVATQLALALGRSVATQELARHAGEDPLTGLLNRRRLDEVLDAALSGAATAGPVAVLTVDLDRFKEVNDAHGHAVGDALLVAVAGRLRSHVREGDAVVRLGGDEFLVMLAGEHAAERAPHLAERLVASIASPFEVVGATVTVGASVGVALAGPGQSADQVMCASDDAMYRAKQGGRGQVVQADGIPARCLERSVVAAAALSP